MYFKLLGERLNIPCTSPYDTMKVMLIILDGMGDRPSEKLEGKTPLEAARTPNMNALARMGINGMMDPIAPGIRAGSDTAHLSILGYDPYEVYTGRGPFEAAGEGLELKPGDVAFRCNFATVDDDMNVTDRRAGRIKEGTKELAKMLDGLKIEGVKVIFKESVEHRAVLVLRGEGLSPNVSDVDPHTLGPIHESKALSEDAEKTARIVNAFVRLSNQLLKDHPVNKERVKKGLPPANIVLPRGAGMVPHLKSIEERYGIKAGAIAGVSIVKGVCRLAGMEIIDVEGAMGTKDSDFNAKVEAGLKYLEKGDMVLINMKAPDLFSHDGDFVGKKRIIERIDKAMAPLKDVLGDVIVAITADHSTPCDVMDHSGDPVPLLIAGKGVRTDNVKSFGERNAARGGLCRIKGNDLLNILLQLAGLSEKFGA